jgi:site-specific DNA-methyltransferase (adenine-specific)
LKALPDDTYDSVLCDPPYNIGKDYGTNKTSMPMDEYVKWCAQWIDESMRILKPDGTLFIWGFAEKLAYLSVYCSERWGVRWLQWSYLNKAVHSCPFYGRSHESVLVVWKKGKFPYMDRDAVRVPYSKTYLKNAGKKRKATKGRFSKGDKETVYKAHPGGALPRDVLCFPALAGGCGAKERQKWHGTQKPESVTRRLLKGIGRQDGPTKVVIPFAGSGTECKVAEELGYEWVAWELNPEYVRLANERISGAGAFVSATEPTTVRAVRAATTVGVALGA